MAASRISMIMTQVKLGEFSGLNDFRTESPYVRSNMAAIYNYWIRQAGFDGFRIDTVKHVEPGFWQTGVRQCMQFAARTAKPNFFMFGEVYDSNEALCGSYTGTQSGGPYKLDSVLDYPLYFLVSSVFATASGATARLTVITRTLRLITTPTRRCGWSHSSTTTTSRAFLQFRHHQPARSRAGVSLHGARRAVSLLRNRTGVQWRDRSLRPRGHVRRTIQGCRPGGRGQFQQDSSAVSTGGQAEQFPPALPALSLGAHVSQWNKLPVPACLRIRAGWAHRRSSWCSTLPARPKPCREWG